MAQVPDAELLTAAMRQELPCGPTDNIDGEPGSRLGALAAKAASLGVPAGLGEWGYAHIGASLASAARFAALPGGQRHAGPWPQEYHRIRGIGSIRYPAGRRCRRRRARRLRAGMNGENIVSTSASFHWLGAAGAAGANVARRPRMGSRRSPLALRRPRAAGGDADPQVGRPPKVIGRRAVRADTAGPAGDWHGVLQVIGIDRCAPPCRTAARASVTQLTGLVSACRYPARISAPSWP